MSDTELLTQLQALEHIQGAQNSENLTNIDRLHVALCGDTGTGKSSLVARTARKPVLFFDGDDRRESIANIPGVFVKTYIDKSDTEPTAWMGLDMDVAALQYAKTKGNLDLKTVCLDSITFWRKYAEHQFLKDASGASRAKYKLGNTEFLIAKDWDAVTGVQKMLEHMLTRLFSLDIDVFVTFHTRNEKDNVRSTKTEAVYKDTLIIEPPNLKMLLPKFNDKWRTFVENGVYKVQLKPNHIFMAATVLKNVEAEEVGDIQKLLEKHNGK